MRKPRAENRWIEKYKVQSNSGSVYTVSLAKDGTWGCSCPAWKFAHERQDCKHIFAMKAAKERLKTEPRLIEVAMGPRHERCPPAFEITTGGFRLAEKIVNAPFATWRLILDWYGGLLWEVPPFHEVEKEKTLVRAVW